MKSAQDLGAAVAKSLIAIVGGVIVLWFGQILPKSEQLLEERYLVILRALGELSDKGNFLSEVTRQKREFADSQGVAPMSTGLTAVEEPTASADNETKNQAVPSGEVTLLGNSRVIQLATETDELRKEVEKKVEPLPLKLFGLEMPVKPLFGAFACNLILLAGLIYLLLSRIKYWGILDKAFSAAKVDQKDPSELLGQVPLWMYPIPRPFLPRSQPADGGPTTSIGRTTSAIVVAVGLGLIVATSAYITLEGLVLVHVADLCTRLIGQLVGADGSKEFQKANLGLTPVLVSFINLSLIATFGLTVLVALRWILAGMFPPSGGLDRASRTSLGITIILLIPLILTLVNPNFGVMAGLWWYPTVNGLFAAIAWAIVGAVAFHLLETLSLSSKAIDLDKGLYPNRVLEKVSRRQMLGVAGFATGCYAGKILFGRWNWLNTSLMEDGRSKVVSTASLPPVSPKPKSTAPPEDKTSLRTQLAPGFYEYTGSGKAARKFTAFYVVLTGGKAPFAGGLPQASLKKQLSFWKVRQSPTPELRAPLHRSSAIFELAALDILNVSILGAQVPNGQIHNRDATDRACSLLILGIKHDLMFKRKTGEKPSMRLYDFLAKLSVKTGNDQAFRQLVKLAEEASQFLDGYLYNGDINGRATRKPEKMMGKVKDSSTSPTDDIGLSMKPQELKILTTDRDLLITLTPDFFGSKKPLGSPKTLAYQKKQIAFAVKRIKLISDRLRKAKNRTDEQDKYFESITEQTAYAEQLRDNLGLVDISGKEVAAKLDPWLGQAIGEFDKMRAVKKPSAADKALAKYYGHQVVFLRRVQALFLDHYVRENEMRARLQKWQSLEWQRKIKQKPFAWSKPEVGQM